MNVFLLTAFIPGPVLYGSVIDSTCELWGESTSGKSTSCSVYNNDAFRWRLHGLTVIFMILSSIMYLITWRLLIIRTKQTEKYPQKTDKAVKETLLYKDVGSKTEAAVHVDQEKETKI